jgi:hypothetical protein
MMEVWDLYSMTTLLLAQTTAIHHAQVAPDERRKYDSCSIHHDHQMSAMVVAACT